MPEPTPQVLASRQLLQEVCTLLAPFRDDAVLIGGWVPEIRFPDAFPGHVGSIDVDFAMRASKARHNEVVALLAKHGFRPGAEPYQFLKNMDVDGKSFPVKLESVGAADVRVAGIVPFVIMKAYAMLERTKPKDAYDLNFCLENYPGGIPALAAEFATFIDDPPVRAVLTKLAGKFRDEEDSGPRDVVEVEEPMGEARAIRKFAVFTNVDDFLRAVGILV